MKTRVLHVIDSLDLGGAQTALLQFIRFRDRERFEVEVASMHGRGVFFDAFMAEGVKVHSLSPSRYLPLYVPALVQLLARGRFDIAHFHLFGSNWIGKPIAGAMAVPVLINHDQCNDRFRSERRWAVRLDALTNRFSTHIVAVSQSTREFLMTQEQVEPQRISVLHNGVDTSHFRPPTLAQRQAARAEWELGAESRIVCGIGRLHPQKNFARFIECAAELSGGVHFLLAGTGPEENTLRELAAASGVLDRLHFCGFVSDTRKVLHAADIFLMTSDYEGLPVALLEAMACGLPCVATAVDGVEEVLANADQGCKVPLDDVRPMVEAVGRLLGDSGERSRIGVAARARVESSFDAAKLTAQLERQYERLLTSCKAAPSSGTCPQ